MFKRKLSVILAATLATTVFAAKYEAESATVSSEAKIVNSNGVSGTGYASLQEGSISFTGVTAETAGKYTLTIHYKAGDYKANYLKVNGATAGTIDFAATTGWADVTTAVTLKAGTNTIAIEKCRHTQGGHKHHRHREILGMDRCGLHRHFCLRIRSLQAICDPGHPERDRKCGKALQFLARELRQEND